jgi:hypothetical protein
VPGRRPGRRSPQPTARALARQALTTDTYGQICMVCYGSVGRFFADQKAIILPEEAWA